jgi:hypothetical protein
MTSSTRPVGSHLFFDPSETGSVPTALPGSPPVGGGPTINLTLQHVEVALDPVQTLPSSGLAAGRHRRDKQHEPIPGQNDQPDNHRPASMRQQRMPEHSGTSSDPA